MAPVPPVARAAQTITEIFMGDCNGSISDGATTVIKGLLHRGILVAELRSLNQIWGRTANVCVSKPETGALQGWQRAEEAYRTRDELVSEVSRTRRTSVWSASRMAAARSPMRCF